MAGAQVETGRRRVRVAGGEFDDQSVCSGTVWRCGNRAHSPQAAPQCFER